MNELTIIFFSRFHAMLLSQQWPLQMIDKWFDGKFKVKIMQSANGGKNWMESCGSINQRNKVSLSSLVINQWIGIKWIELRGSNGIHIQINADENRNKMLILRYPNSKPEIPNSSFVRKSIIFLQSSCSTLGCHTCIDAERKIRNVPNESWWWCCFRFRQR